MGYVNHVVFARQANGLGPDEKPTRKMRNEITELCRNGEFKSAMKIGRKWYIDDKEEKRIWDEKNRPAGAATRDGSKALVEPR